MNEIVKEERLKGRKDENRENRGNRLKSGNDDEELKRDKSG